MHAMGLRSEAATAHPRRAASKGIWPEPQKVSATRGRWPKRMMPNCSINSGNECAAVPRCALTASQMRSEEHTSELQSLRHLVCRLLLVKHNSVHWLHRYVASYPGAHHHLSDHPPL